MAGWIASGVVAIGDVRDLAASVCSGDLASIGVNLLAFAPGAGDSLKVTSIVTKFVGKHPEMLGPVTTFVGGLLKQDEAADVAKAAENLITAPSESAVRSYGVKNWKAAELFLKEKVGGEPQKRFVFPEEVGLGDRIVDQYSNGIAHEIKMGRVYATQFVKAQIDKDIQLLKNSGYGVEGVTWHFVKSEQTGKIGPSTPLARYIQKQCDKEGLTFGEDFKITIYN